MLRKNQLMDWIRGASSCWVVLFHLNEVVPFVGGAYAEFCKLGWLGVAAFFAVSGWCMSQLASGSPLPVRFLVGRLLRIMPPYWASLGVVAAAIALRMLFTGTNDLIALPRTMSALLATLVLATEPVSGVTTVNWVYWSLSYEVAFYLLTAVAIATRRPDVSIFCFLAVSVLMAKFRIGDVTHSPLFWCLQFPLFSLGWFAQTTTKAGGTLLAWLGLIASALACGVYGTLAESIAGVVTVLAVLLGHARAKSAPSASAIADVLAYLGRISYSIYLIHVPVGCWLLLRYRTQAVLDGPVAHIAYDFAVLLTCIAAAGLFHRWIELPSHALSRRFRPTAL